jgi:archaellum biogenesis ATPase FlaH
MTFKVGIAQYSSMALSLDSTDKPALSVVKDADVAVQEFHKIIEKTKDLQQKKEEIETARVDYQYEQLAANDKNKLISETLNIEDDDTADIDKVRREDNEYMVNARKSMFFINQKFSGKVPFFSRNVLLIGGVTGTGKSTTAANIALSVLAQNKKVLILTNEEAVGDIYNRITCLVKGWRYVNHQSFTDEQCKILDEYKVKLSTRVKVIDNDYKGLKSATRSVEGIKSLFDSLVRNKNEFGVVIIDYYQKVNQLLSNPNASSNEVSEKFCDLLDKFKNQYSAPIVVLSQLYMTNDKKGRGDFDERIKGRKIILDTATYALEIAIDRDLQKTTFICQKARFGDFVGKEIDCGFKNGKYIDYDTPFQQEVESRKIAKLIKKTEGEQP